MGKKRIIARERSKKDKQSEWASTAWATTEPGQERFWTSHGASYHPALGAFLQFRVQFLCDESFERGNMLWIEVENNRGSVATYVKLYRQQQLRCCCFSMSFFVVRFSLRKIVGRR
jgi:hypothetical protein